MGYKICDNPMSGNGASPQPRYRSFSEHSGSSSAEGGF